MSSLIDIVGSFKNIDSASEKLDALRRSITEISIPILVLNRDQTYPSDPLIMIASNNVSIYCGNTITNHLVALAKSAALVTGLEKARGSKKITLCYDGDFRELTNLVDVAKVARRVVEYGGDRNLYPIGKSHRLGYPATHIFVGKEKIQEVVSDLYLGKFRDR